MFVYSRCNLRVLAAAILSLSLSSCAKVKVTGKLISSGPDFLATEIINNGPVVADGHTILTVGIQLRNSDNTVVSGYLPTYEISSGAGVVPGACTTSLPNGMSYCLLRATLPGTKVMKLTNAKIGLEANLDFLAQTMTNSILGAVPASQTGASTSGGYAVSATVGSTMGSSRAVSNGGYAVYLNVQGALVSP